MDVSKHMRFFLMFQFGSWLFPTSKLNLQFSQGIEGVDLNEIIPSKEWEIVGNTAIRNDV